MVAALAVDGGARARLRVQRVFVSDGILKQSRRAVASFVSELRMTRNAGLLRWKNYFDQIARIRLPPPPDASDIVRPVVALAVDSTACGGCGF